jgi:hypothetical protein
VFGGVPEVPWGNAADSLERLGEGELVFIADEACHRGDAVAAGESLAGDCHAPSPHVGERRLADRGTKAPGKRGARYPRSAGERSDRPWVAGIGVHGAQRRADDVVVQRPDPCARRRGALGGQPGT